MGENQISLADFLLQERAHDTCLFLHLDKKRIYHVVAAAAEVVAVAVAVAVVVVAVAAVAV